jgi:hypothetical protein
MWIKVDAATKKIYEKKEEEDKKRLVPPHSFSLLAQFPDFITSFRYERELAEWKKANPSASGEASSSTTPSAKKAKVNKD